MKRYVYDTNYDDNTALRAKQDQYAQKYYGRPFSELDDQDKYSVANHFYKVEDVADKRRRLKYAYQTGDYSQVFEFEIASDLMKKPISTLRSMAAEYPTISEYKVKYGTKRELANELSWAIKANSTIN